VTYDISPEERKRRWLGLTTMTYDEARAQAVTDARRTGRPQQVWQHTGGETPTGYVSSRGTFLARDATTRAPRFCWTLVETVEP